MLLNEQIDKLAKRKLQIESIKDKHEIVTIDKQIEELSKKKHHMEGIIGESYPSDAEELKYILPCLDGQSKSFFERIQQCIELVENIKTKVLDNYKVSVTPHDYTQRGSDNYLVSWSNIESHSYWSDDEYLNLPKIHIELSSYHERENREWRNPEYPTFEDGIKAAQELEVKCKKEIAEFFDTKYNKSEHLRYLVDKCLRFMSQTSSWDYQVLKPIISNNGYSEIFDILRSFLPQEYYFIAKRLIIDLLVQKLKRFDSYTN